MIGSLEKSEEGSSITRSTTNVRSSCGAMPVPLWRPLPPEFVRQSRGPNFPEKIQKEARTDAWGRTLPDRRLRIRGCRRKQKGRRHLVSIRLLFRRIAYRESGREGRLRDGWTARSRRVREADSGRRRWRASGGARAHRRSQRALL